MPFTKGKCRQKIHNLFDLRTDKVKGLQRRGRDAHARVLFGKDCHFCPEHTALAECKHDIGGSTYTLRWLDAFKGALTGLFSM